MLAALGQRDVERRRRMNRVVKEELVKIAHPVEQERVWVAPLDLQILRHHRGGVGGDFNRLVHALRRIRTDLADH